MVIKVLYSRIRLQGFDEHDGGDEQPVDIRNEVQPAHHVGGPVIVLEQSYYRKDLMAL